MIYLAAFATGLVAEYWFGLTSKTVAFAKAIWAKIRGVV